VGDWTDVLDEDSSGRAYVVSSNPGDRVIFRFSGSAVNLIGRRSVIGGRLYVSLDDGTVSGLPTDDEGRSYVDLRGLGDAQPDRIPLLVDESPREHRLELQVGTADGVAGICIVDAFEVLAAERPLPVVWLVSSGIGTVLSGWWLWRSWRRLRWVI